MQYRPDPKSGNQLSVLGFGCMRFPRGLANQIDVNKSEQLIIESIDKGVNYFDTAYLYRGSEETLGTIIERNDIRPHMFLATKLPHARCKSESDFDRLFNEQLRRLKTDYIDYYLIHNIADPLVWKRLCGLGIETWIDQKKNSGQIRQLGFSFHGALDGFLGLLDAYPWDFCQIQYNYLDENYQAGRTGMLRAAALGLPVIVMEPLLGGKLATGLPAAARRHFAQADPRVSPASWALRWLWDQPEPTVVLSGMNSAEQLADNLAAASSAAVGMLSEKERAVFAPVVEAVRAAYRVPCTGCNYCMPCPHNVNIPGVFSAYNARHALGMIAGTTQYLTSTNLFSPNGNLGPRNCTRCGRCEAKCPQKIAIPDELAAALRRMEPFWIKPVLSIARKLL